MKPQRSFAFFAALASLGFCSCRKREFADQSNTSSTLEAPSAAPQAAQTQILNHEAAVAALPEAVEISRNLSHEAVGFSTVNAANASIRSCLNSGFQMVVAPEFANFSPSHGYYTLQIRYGSRLIHNHAERIPLPNFTYDAQSSLEVNLARQRAGVVIHLRALMSALDVYLVRISPTLKQEAIFTSGVSERYVLAVTAAEDAAAQAASAAVTETLAREAAEGRVPADWTRTGELGRAFAEFGEGSFAEDIRARLTAEEIRRLTAIRNRDAGRGALRVTEIEVLQQELELQRELARRSGNFQALQRLLEQVRERVGRVGR